MSLKKVISKIQVHNIILNYLNYRTQKILFGNFQSKIVGFEVGRNIEETTLLKRTLTLTLTPIKNETFEVNIVFLTIANYNNYNHFLPLYFLHLEINPRFLRNG